ncbi:MAG: xanthine permease [Oscillibacter sp.]|jgi:AGZA family xanthine/uracil permease-like MFS transporter|nr:xanthine permease [Oscillibacter sp.]
MFDKNNAARGTPLWVAGDLNGFFGLFSNSLANFLTAIALLAVAISMPADIVYGKIVPATALAIALGNFILAYLARRMSVREDRSDVTAMPYGISVPHYYAVALAVILPTYISTGDWMLAWATGMVWNFVEGVIMLIGAFAGPFIKKNIPRSAMLGALAGFALTFIAGNPIGEVFTTPYIGLVCFVILMVGWLGHKRLPFNIPTGAFAILVGTILAWVTGYMDPAGVSQVVENFNVPFPSLMFGLFTKGFAYIAPFLPAAIPLGIYDFLESMDNLESADAAGEHYPVALCMTIPAILTILSSFMGGVFPTIIYIGHPGWKAAGARVGYSILTGTVILVLSFTGIMALATAVIPLVAMLPILMYIGMIIGTQAFSTAKPRHMPAVVLAFLPYIGSFLTSKISSSINAVNEALAAAGSGLSVALGGVTSGNTVGVAFSTLSGNGVPFEGWQRLSQGDIIIAMILSTIVYFIIDRHYTKAAVYCGIGAALSFFGIIHSGSFGINVSPAVTIGYLLAGAVLLVMMVYRKEDNVLDPEVALEEAQELGEA